MNTLSSMTPAYRIGLAAQKSGVSAANIRYYEKENLISVQRVSDNGYRLYSDSEVHQLRFIRLCRAMDMSLDEVRVLLSLDLASKSDCARATRALNEHLAHVQERLAELQTLAEDLQALRSRCDGGDATCHLIEALHAKADQLKAGQAVARRPRHV